MLVSRLRRTAFVVGLLAMVAAAGVAIESLATEWRLVSATLDLTSRAENLSSDLELWNDRNRTDSVSSLRFEGVQLKAPLSTTVAPVSVFVENTSTGDRLLLGPCGRVSDTESRATIGSISAVVYDLDGRLFGNTCDMPQAVKLGPGQLVETRVLLSLEESLGAGEYQFLTPFQAVGETRIAFTTDRDGYWEGYVMDADGSNQTRKTFNPRTNPAWNHDEDPVWSPDGTRIAFNSNRDGNWEVYVMDADGSDQTNLTNSTAHEFYPDWSPDGDKIAFNSDRDGDYEIFVMDADGSHQTPITDNTSDERWPTWSPDGKRIAFHSDRDGNREIYSVNADGSGLTRLTSNQVEDRWAAWSPNGNKISFVSDRDGNREIYVMDADGSNQTRLTNNTAEDRYHNWSPDGKQIAFSSVITTWEIYIMDADGANLRHITPGGTNDWLPAWSPGIVPNGGILTSSTPPTSATESGHLAAGARSGPDPQVMP